MPHGEDHIVITHLIIFILYNLTALEQPCHSLIGYRLEFRFATNRSVDIDHFNLIVSQAFLWDQCECIRFNCSNHRSEAGYVLGLPPTVRSTTVGLPAD